MCLSSGALAKPGIRFSEHLESDGAIVFKKACQVGLEGIVSKRIDAPYRSGRAKVWLKVRNRKAPASYRVEDGTF